MKNINILVLNCGSSSLKYKLITMPGSKVLVAGEAQRVGVKTKDKGVIIHWSLGKKKTISIDLPDHLSAFCNVMDLIEADHRVCNDIKVNYFAHRYVHPGNIFKKTTLVTKKNLNLFSKTVVFAPIHNPVSYRLIKTCFKQYPKIKQYVVFDTIFHKTIPKELSAYALPAKLVRKYKIRKIGFHGISHKYVMQEACAYLKRTVDTQKIISCHLGTGGSSICAIKNGKSINNSMGFTPLDGLVMNTRSGSLDIGTLLYIMFYEKLSAGDAEIILNKKSGILGLFNQSSDLRDVAKNINKDFKAKITIDMYIRRIKKCIGYYSSLLEKTDIIVFTDTLGVEMAYVREKICAKMDIFGIKIESKKNRGYKKGIQDISAADSTARILIIPADEELMIAREAYERYSIDC